MKRFLIAALLMAAPLMASAASLCLGDAGVACKTETVQTVLVVGSITLPTASASMEDGHVLHLQLSGPATFASVPEPTGGELIGSSGANASYMAEGDLTINDLEVTLTEDAMLGDKVLLRMHAVNPNGTTETLADQTFKAVEIIGFTHTMIPVVNPANNATQQSLIRLTNPTSSECAITFQGIDDAGQVSSPAHTLIGAGQSKQVTAEKLEAGGDDVIGGFGDGEGKWRVSVDADCYGIIVQALMRNNNTGTLTNLSGVVE